MMISKQNFPTTSEEGETFVCQVDGRLYSQPIQNINITSLTKAIDHHPKVNISRDILHGTTNRDDLANNIFSPVQEPLLKKLVHTWYEQGLLHTFQLAHEESQSTIIRSTAAVLLKTMHIFNRISNFFQPQLPDSGPKLIESLTTSNNWRTALVRCISWHPQLTKLAVACLDDSVRIYTEDSSNVLILKLRFQKNITCLAWRPNSWSELALAVGCENGIVLWSLDPNLMVLRPSSNNAQILNIGKNMPVMSLMWDPLGSLLASVSIHDCALTVWDVYKRENSRMLYRAARGGLHNAKWSLNGTKLFVASIGITFRIYNCERWSSERWNITSGRVQTACFSPCGTVLLFCSNSESVIYALRSNSDGIWSKESDNSLTAAIPVLSFSRTSDIIGTLIQDLQWDSSGNYLAVMFKDSTYIAIFKTNLSPTLQFTPCCLLNGLEFEQPIAIDFQKNFQHGACLTIAWSSGRIQHFPITTTILNGLTGRSFDTNGLINSWS